MKYKLEVFDSEGTLAIQRENGQDILHLKRVDKATATDEDAEPGWMEMSDAEHQAIIDAVVNALGGGEEADDETNTFDASTLDDDSRAQYERRYENGRIAVGMLERDDEETQFSDLVSDMLTFLYGPAGYTEGFNGGLAIREDEQLAARALLDRAMRSWEGDAEDYTVES